MKGRMGRWGRGKVGEREGVSSMGRGRGRKRGYVREDGEVGVRRE